MFRYKGYTVDDENQIPAPFDLFAGGFVKIYKNGRLVKKINNCTNKMAKQFIDGREHR